MPDKFPSLKAADLLTTEVKRLYIGAYGFEERSLGWLKMQVSHGDVNIIESALMIKYGSPKGKNKIQESKKLLKKSGVKFIKEISYDINQNPDIEVLIEDNLKNLIFDYDEVVLEITALTKFLILIYLDKLAAHDLTLRLIYTEAKNYAPTKQDYYKAIKKINSVMRFPSKGFGTILRSRSLSSIRMQGQPVVLVAFASFNENLIRHMLGTLSPHRLIFINGRPPHTHFNWREEATLQLHRKLVEEYPYGNEVNSNGELLRTTSTLFYEETIKQVKDIYQQFGLQERIIIAVTGSKMQAVGVFFSKRIFEDLHIEYPTPDSYYISGYSTGTGQSHEVCFTNFYTIMEHVKE